MARIIRLSRPAPQNGNDLAGLGMAFGRLGDDYSGEDYSSMEMPQEYDTSMQEAEAAYNAPPEESEYDTSMKEAEAAYNAPDKTSPGTGKTTPASPGFNWAALDTGLKTATGLLTAGGNIYSAQQQGKIAAGAQQLALTQAQLAAQQKSGTASGGISAALASMPSWALPAIIGGVALLVVGGIMLKRRSAPVAATNPRRRRNRRRR